MAAGGDAITAQQHTYVATVAALAALLPVENVEGPELDSDEEALGASSALPSIHQCCYHATAEDAPHARLHDHTVPYTATDVKSFVPRHCAGTCLIPIIPAMPQAHPLRRVYNVQVWWLTLPHLLTKDLLAPCIVWHDFSLLSGHIGSGSVVQLGWHPAPRWRRSWSREMRTAPSPCFGWRGACSWRNPALSQPMVP